MVHQLYWHGREAAAAARGVKADGGALWKVEETSHDFVDRGELSHYRLLDPELRPPQGAFSLGQRSLPQHT